VELRAHFEVEYDTQAYENRQLRLQIRNLCNQQGLVEVCDSFESDLQRLVRENEQLRTRNLELESKELDLLTGSDSRSHENSSAIAADHSIQSKRLVTRLKKTSVEKDSLKASYEVLKAKERQFVMNDKISKDALRRLRVTHQDLMRCKKDLETCRMVLLKKESELHILQQDSAGWKEQEFYLKEERARLFSEVQTLRGRIQDFETQEHRAIQLSRTLDKFATGKSTSARPNNDKFDLNAHNSNYVSAKIFAMDEALRTQEKQHRQPLLPGHGVPATVVGNIHPETLRTHASYLRNEEKDVISADLELTIAALHDALVANAPRLIPLLRKLVHELQQERSFSIQQRAVLLDNVVRKTASSKRIDQLKSR
jgi:hypothetical protein